jgi:hypothetical protein
MARTGKKGNSMNLIMKVLVGIGTMIAGFLGLVALSKNETVQERLKQHYEESMDAARDAAAAKRQELETDLEKMKAE